MYLYMYMYVCVYVYIYIYMYTHIFPPELRRGWQGGTRTSCAQDAGPVWCCRATKQDSRTMHACLKPRAVTGRGLASLSKSS